MTKKFSIFGKSEFVGPQLSSSRRQFLRDVIASGVLGSALVPGSLASALQPDHKTNQRQTLSGTTFNLSIGQVPVNFTGSPRMANAINGSIPAPTLRWKEGEEVTINVTNHLSEPTSIHWHGIILPYQMDGVPGLSFPGIPPGQTFQYKFKINQSGTYWYHSHSGFQEMRGMYGAIIVEPAGGEQIHADRDHVVLLSEWTDEDPAYAFQKLKTLGHLYNFNQPTLGRLWRDIQEMGLEAAADKREMFNKMRMKPTDLADLSANTLTYLANGTTPERNDHLSFNKGERVRLRVINAAGNTFFDMRIPDLPMTVVQVDGLNTEPVTVDEFRLGPGETFDVLVDPTDDAHTIFAETMERTGYARATLGIRPGLKAPIPERRQVQWLSMQDMMGNMPMGDGHMMEGMDHGDMHMEHSGMQLSDAPPIKAWHASTEFGRSTDMRVDFPRTSLDDPGVGLRNMNHRVLTLADIRTLGGEIDPREPEREIELHLTGNMERYSWSIDGLEYGMSTPVHFRFGEKLRVHLHNDTMMTHPMHLHGMWSDLEDERGNFLARRHIIPVQPAQRVSFSVTADALGRWAWHCHLLFHMDAGMFREVIVT